MKIRCVYMRGGTSKAVIFHEKDLPADRSVWPRLFLKVMGSPDPKQIDGMGGTYQVTSKLAVIAPSVRPGIDVDYTFFQIGIDTPVVADTVNCGNISSAVGPFAVDEGLVPAVTPVTVVRIFNTNTGKIMEEHVPVSNDAACVSGDVHICGVPGTGAGIDVFFESPGGSATGKLLPTGHVKDMLFPEGWPPVEATLIDCSNPVVILRAADLGLDGAETDVFMRDKALLQHIEAIRSEAAVLFGFVGSAAEATGASLARPKVAVISSPHDYIGSDGVPVSGAQTDLCSRIVSVGAFHKTHPITSGIALAAAAGISGTVADELARPGRSRNELRIGHPQGIMPIKILFDGNTVLKAGTVRTARRIMDGCVYVDL